MSQPTEWTPTVVLGPFRTHVVYVSRNIPDFPELAPPVIEVVDAGRPEHVRLPGQPAIRGITYDYDHPRFSLVTIEYTAASTENGLYSVMMNCMGPCRYFGARDAILEDWELTEVGPDFAKVLHRPSGVSEVLRGAWTDSDAGAPAHVEGEKWQRVWEAVRGEEEKQMEELTGRIGIGPGPSTPGNSYGWPR